MHPRNLGSHVTVRPPVVRPQHRHTNIKQLNQQVWQPKCNTRFYLEENRTAARTFREKEKKQQSRVFFDVIFYVDIHVDNRGRARESAWKQRRRILLEEKHENFIVAVRKWEILAASKVKMSDSEKIKENMNTGNKIFGKHIRQFFRKNNLWLTGKFDVLVV